MKTSKSKKPKDEKAGEFSLTVTRALEVLLLFATKRSELGISELARELSLSKASVQRSMRALEKFLFVEQNPETRKYRIGVQSYRLGQMFAHRGLLDVAEPLMHETVADAGHTAYLALMRQDTMVIVSSVEGPGPIRFSIPIGRVLPIYESAVGKAALSTFDSVDLDTALQRFRSAGVDVKALRTELLQIRSRGFSTNWNQLIPGVGAVAAPICDTNGKLIAVVSVGFGIGQVLEKDLPKIGRQINSVARSISQLHARDSQSWNEAKSPRGRKKLASGG